MQQPPNLFSQDPQQEYQQPLQQQPRKQPPKKNLWKLLWLLVVPVFVIAIILGLASRGQNQQSATTQPTIQPTQKPIIPTRLQIDTLLISNEPDVTIASYNQQSATLVLQESFSSIVPISQNEIKHNLQDIQVKVWQQDWYFSQVTVNVLQAQHNGQNKKIGYGVITGKTASSINWTFEHYLWDKYDQKYVDPSLPNF